METFLLENDREIYTVAFFGTIAIVAFWEGVLPRRQSTQPLRTRWFSNSAIALANLGAISLVFPIAALAFSIIIAEHGIGLFQMLDVPTWLAILLGILSIDCGRWLHHYLMHRVPFLWRLHRVHHADHDYDFTVGLRFHPFEGLFTTGFVFPIILLLGPPPVAVLVAEFLVGVSGIIVHANGRIAYWLDRYVRLIFVTPDMHRVHHSIVRGEHDSNYAAVFSFWDRLFGTYVAAPAAGHTGMTIGLPELRDSRCLKLGWMLLSPFQPMPKSLPKDPIKPN
ncbi:MAG: sterol desaturase family protein [Alphaproteobacteria bacterium]|nr:sterol desaturase family protein [Alphaproteobacteria bacterium]